MITTLTQMHSDPRQSQQIANDRQSLIYVAAAYTRPDPVENTHAVIKIADAILDAGFTPLVPHLTLAWHLVSPKKYETWLAYDCQLLAHCDAVLRVPGRRGRIVRHGSNFLMTANNVISHGETIRPSRSSGATRETQFVDAVGIPVIRPRSADAADCVTALVDHDSNQQESS